MRLNKTFFKENWYYIIISIVGLAVILTNRILTGFNEIMVLSDVASIFAIAYIIFNAKNSVWGLLFNLISTAFVAVTSFYQHIWLNGFICVFINIPMFILGIINWKKKLAKQSSKIRINKLSKRNLAFVFLGYTAVSVAFLFILKALNGNLFYLDAIYSAGSVIGVILCSYAFIDQFYIFYVADVAGIAMYTILCTQNINNLPLLFMNVMFLFGTLIGNINWIRLQKKDRGVKEKYVADIPKNETNNQSDEDDQNSSVL